MTSAANPPAAAIAARRRQTRNKLTQLERAVTQLRRETVFTQRKRIGELMGQLREVEQSAPRTPPQPSAPRTPPSSAVWTR
ncbi:hypothetical protein SO3561_06110 [Streptomyces olivochromogenes]|uniref:Uncharacterized protein n=1 Tax=Streptomyces olivochromogenes TaxID=1963 RepID=A0A250VKF9_STROL|nr:hypothetical protein SO3561_06110 [Streptomyces olivochromogenes]